MAKIMRMNAVELVVDRPADWQHPRQQFGRCLPLDEVSAQAGGRTQIGIDGIAANHLLTDRLLGSDLVQLQEVPVPLMLEREFKCRDEVVMEDHIIFEDEQHFVVRFDERLPGLEVAQIAAHFAGQHAPPDVAVEGLLVDLSRDLGPPLLAIDGAQPLEVERQLRESGAFDSISRSSEAPDARGMQEFTVNATAIKPTYTVAFPADQDFAKTSMRERRYGPPPEDVDAAASGIDAKDTPAPPRDAPTRPADEPPSPTDTTPAATAAKGIQPRNAEPM